MRWYYLFFRVQAFEFLVLNPEAFLMLLGFHLCSKWSGVVRISVSQQKTLEEGRFQPLLSDCRNQGISPSLPHTGVYAVSFPGSQILTCRLPYTTDFPGSLACRWQNVGLSLHNHVRQFLIVNQSLSLSLSLLSLLSLNSFRFCFSGKP